VIIVDDNSPDGTYEVAKQMQIYYHNATDENDVVEEEEELVAGDEEKQIPNSNLILIARPQRLSMGNLKNISQLLKIKRSVIIIIIKIIITNLL
jgi:glycosyltransferase involved in cell wall biosynthesis